MDPCSDCARGDDRCAGCGRAMSLIEIAGHPSELCAACFQRALFLYERRVLRGQDTSS